MRLRQGTKELFVVKAVNLLTKYARALEDALHGIKVMH